MSLTHLQAQVRHALISVESYSITIDLTGAIHDAGDDSRFQMETEVSFRSNTPGAETFIEVAAAEDLTATLNGSALDDSCYSSPRLRLDDLQAENTLTVSASLPYAPDGDGMHRYVDPADGQVYVCGFAGMDVAQRMFACFDQPDLKAPLSLQVKAPAHWTIRANGVQQRREETEDGNTLWTFGETKPLSTYLFVLCAGPWVSHEWQHDGLSFGWHAKASLADALDRDIEHLKDLTNRYYDYYHSVFEAKYPFEHYHQVFAPGLNWGALETPGCVTFRDEMLPTEEPTETQRVNRACVIAHEMAHMWFGNLVTMQWWEDTWLQESFADYMGYHVATAAADLGGSWVGFALDRKVRAYLSDSRNSTHPVAPGDGAVADVDTAFTIFDAISYSKGTSLLQQLVHIIGPEAFWKGLNEYLTTFAFSNAQLNDLLQAFDNAAEIDVMQWAQTWFRETGFDTLRVEPCDGAHQLVVDGHRSHSVEVTPLKITGNTVVMGDRARISASPDSPVQLPETSCAADELLVMFPNTDDTTFASMRVSDDDRDALAPVVSAVPDPLTRAVVWWSLLSSTAAGEWPINTLLDVATDQLPQEHHAILLDRVLQQVQRTGQMLLEPTEWSRRAAQLADALLAADHSGQADAAEVSVRHAIPMMADADQVAALLDSPVTAQGVTMSQELRWLALARLASLGVLDADRIDAELSQDQTSRGIHAAATTRASMRDATAKRAAYDLIFGDLETVPGTRISVATLRGLWHPEHWDEVGPLFDRYLVDAPKLAHVSQGLADVLGQVFPNFRATPEVVQQLETVLASGTVPTVLARHWNDHLDDLRVAVGVRAGQQVNA